MVDPDLLRNEFIDQTAEKVVLTYILEYSLHTRAVLL